MSTYTIELGLLIKSGYDIGLKDYPIPSFADETWRNELNKKIVRHYYFNEICCTTPDKWKVLFNNTMNEIMPIKCLQYEALRQLVDPFASIVDTYSEESGNSSTSNETTHSSTNANANSSTSSNDYSVTISSNTPGQMLNVEDDISNNTYADKASKNKGNASSSGNNSSNSSNDSTGSNTVNSNRKILSTREIKGVHGKSQAQVYKEYIESINNIDMEIINALSTCFMGIF